MGAHLVAEALARWTHVSDRAFRVLVRMALTALDSPSKGRPAAVYHGGRELLAMSLRSEKGTPETRYRAVKRAVAELTEAGAIEHLRTGWAGQNAVYRLTLGHAPSIGGDRYDLQEMGGPTSPPEGGPTSPPMGGPSGPEWGASKAPPRNQEEPLDERGEEEVVDLKTTSHPPRVTAPERQEPNLSSASKPGRCGHGFVIKQRADGRPTCALCRVAEDRPGTTHPPPPDEDHVAPVYDFFTREVS